MNKQEILNNLETSREDLLDIITELPLSVLTKPGVTGNWSIKDILAHLTRWEAELIKMLWQTKQGKKPTSIHFEPKLDVDRVNAQWYEEMKDRPWERVIEDFQAVRNQTILRVEEFSDQELTDPRRFPWLKNTPLSVWIANDSYEHEREHQAEIQKWLAQQSGLKDTQGSDHAT